MSTSSFPYVHQPLTRPSDQIRLLRVLPGCRADPIKCTLERVHRKAEPEYLAVSYTWGDASQVNTIYVNGKSLEVRHNCFFALWQLRVHRFDLPIWIDSICIDQSNNDEKSSQVRLMGSIYARAKLTTSCIGESLQLHAVVLDIAQHEPFASSFVEDYHGSLRPDRTDNVQLESVWSNLLALASNPYFKRLWIVQEIYHAKKIMILCGEDVLPWHTLQTFFLAIAEITSDLDLRAGAMAELPDLDGTELARFIHFRKFRRIQTELKTGWTDEITGHGFTGILLSFGGGACMDPRDKIYGLLSLAQDIRWLVNFPVDYKRSLLDVLKDVVSRIGVESLTENSSRLIANMLEWFNIEPSSESGLILLRSTKLTEGLKGPWSGIYHHRISYESVRVWRVCSLPGDTERSIPHTKNVVQFFNERSIQGESEFGRLNWRQVCLARGTFIRSNSEYCWVAGPEVRPRDVIVEFEAMRDDKDEYSSVVICRPLHRKSKRMDMVGQATALADLEAYDTIYTTNMASTWHPEALSVVERRYLRSRMLYARPHEDRMTVHLRPFDLIKLVMLRGHIVNRIRYPILSEHSGSYTTVDEGNENQVRTGTFTITPSGEEVR